MFNRQTILLIGLGLAAAAGIGFYLSNRTPDDTLLTTETLAGGGTEQELVATLLALRAVSLEGAIFLEPSFLVLNDSSSPIIAEPIGRPNPFAPLSGAAAATSTPDTTRAFGPARR